MKSYSISSQALAKLRMRYVRGSGSFFAVVFCIAMAIVVWNSPDNRPISIIATIIVGAMFIPFSIWRGLKQNKAILESVRIEVGDDYIARSQVRIPQLRINRQEITAVDELSAGLCIRTNNKTRALAIPNALDEDDYKEIRDVLASWATIRPQPKSSKTQNLLIFFLLVIAIGIFIFSTSLWLVLVSSLFLIASFGYYYWVLRQAQGVDPRTRRGMLIVLLVLLLMAAGKLIAFSNAFQTWISSTSQ